MSNRILNKAKGQGSTNLQLPSAVAELPHGAADIFDIDLLFEKFKPKNFQDCCRVANYICTGRNLRYHSEVKFGLFQKILEIDKSGVIGTETSAEKFFSSV